MGYLRGQGDYYAGDYYAGDPGLFGNIFRAVTHTVGGAIGGFLKGGPIGGIMGAVRGAAGGAQANIEADAREIGGSSGGVNPGNLPMRITPPPSTGAIITQSPMGTPVHPAAIAMQVQRMRRLHPNKSTYVTRGGGTSHWPPGLAIHPKGSTMVPHRRMNVGNAKALRRALRRVAGFAKVTKRVRRAVSMAASAVGVRRHHGKAIRRR